MILLHSLFGILWYIAQDVWQTSAHLLLVFHVLRPKEREQCQLFCVDSFSEEYP